MRAVWSWLLELAELPDRIDWERGAEALTGAGLEVEEVERLGDGFSGVVVAEVVGKRPHPKAERLTLVDVITEAGGAATEVVCGAANVPEPGGRVLWARPGARLPGLEIEPREIKGVVSAGMLCAEDELGLGDDHDGIVILDRGAPLGAVAQDALGLRDIVFDIGVPANRPDANGHLGLARELAALCGGRVRPPLAALDELTDPRLKAAELVGVRVEAPARCSRYVARVIDGVTVGRSPLWMQRRLRAVGVRPLSNLIDVTNYVMFELGQPLHAFDYAKVRGAAIHVRLARAGETMTTLDDVERELAEDDLLICDAEGPVALAGVMGGATSEVGDATRRVLLEAAGFETTGIRRTARRLNLHSESSHRFERGVDVDGAELASRRAARLLAELGGGQVARGVVDAYPRPPAPVVIALRPARASALTGVSLSSADCRSALESIELEVADGPHGSLQVTCPSFRPDLSREVDLIEEVIRLRGFDSVPATLPRNDLEPAGVGDARPATARRALVAAGLSEAVTFGFTSPARTAALRFPPDDRRAAPLPLRNPLRGDHSVMRTSLLPNLLVALARNLSYGEADVRLFEVGSVFLPTAPGQLPDEPPRAAAVLTGARAGWLTPEGALDFYDLKGIVDALVRALVPDAAARVGIESAAGIPFLHPGVAGRLWLDGERELGVLGELHPDVRAELDIAPAVFAFELALDVAPKRGPVQMQPIPRFPAITRDLSFFVDESVPAARVRDLLLGQREPLLERVEVLEDYRHPDHVPAGRKGMLWSATYRSLERTLTDAEVDAAHEVIVAQVLLGLGAVRR
jgi:phenylalanyl-tRNA synthetase beta chain